MSETYICTEGFEVETHGTTHIVEEIQISAPTARMQPLFSRLEAENNKLYKSLILFQKEMDSFSSENSIDDVAPYDKDKKEDSEAEKIEQFLTQMKLTGFNPSSCYSILKDLVCVKKNPSKMVSNSGEFNIESGHWDDIPMKEVQRLLAFYVINFIGSLG